MATDIGSTTPVSIFGQDGNELLRGGAGDDFLLAAGGVDTLEGLGGNDQYLSSGGEDVVVRLGPGFGLDTLSGDDTQAFTVEFQAGIDAAQVQLSLQLVNGRPHAVLSVLSSGDALHLDHSNVTVKFADGSQWSSTEFQSRLTALVGTDQNDWINGQALLQTVRAYQGDDTLSGSAANKRLQGDEGNDTILQGGAREATLLGGEGNDRLAVEGYGNTLWGGAGQDTYLIGYSSSGSIIEVQSGEPKEDASDTVDLRLSGLTQRLDDGELLGSARIDVVNGQRDLVISRRYYPNTADVLRIRNVDDPQLSGLQFRLDSNSPFVLAEMVRWAETGVLADNIRPVQWVGTEGADVLNGGDSDDTLIGLGGADTLNSRTGNDVLIGGDGDDVLNFASGRGVLVGGDGADTYIVGNLADTQVEIVEAGADHTGLDVLKLSGNINNLQVQVSGQDLVLGDNIGFVKATVKDFFSLDPALRSGIDRYDIQDESSGVAFSFTPQAMAGAALGATQGIESEADLLLGGAGADVLQGGSHQAIGFQDFISGGAGDDTIRTFSGARVSGGEGNDVIDVLQFRGDTGQIAVSGGAGNDTITVISDQLYSDAEVVSVSGGAGSDLVVIKSDRANVSTNYGAGDVDRLLLVGSMISGTALTASDVSVRRTSNDARRGSSSQYQLLWNDAQGRAQGQVFFQASVERMDTPLVTFTDGAFWSQTDLNRLATQGSAADDDLNGTSFGNDLLIGGAGNDTLRGWGGNDTYDGGAGDDEINLYGAYGYNDTVVRFGPGGGRDFVSMWSVGGNNAGPATLELSAETQASDWSVTSLSPRPDSFQTSTTFTHRVTGESIRFSASPAYGGIHVPVMVRFGATGGTQSVDEFILSSGVEPPPPPPPAPLLLQGTQTDDVLVGGALDDTLIGMGGNDTLTGGRGNDVIDAAQDDDVVRYALGDGDDAVYVDPFANGILELDGPFLPTDLSVKQQDDGIRLSFGALPGSVTYVFDINLGPPNVEIRHSASSSSAGSINLGELWLRSPANLDIGKALTGTDGADSLRGSFGRDTLVGGAGADVLIGDSNSDVYQGGAGDDLIIDRPGASFPRIVRDRNYFLGGQDTYLFARGDGVDTVIDTGPSSRADILQFGEGITLADIELVRRSAVGALDARSPTITTALPQLDYEIYRIKGTLDEIRFTADVAEASPGPEWLRFADGTVVEASQLLVGAAAPIGMNVNGTDLSESLGGTTLADTLAGGLGNDTLNGDTGSDHYVFSAGDGIDLIQEAPRNAGSADTDTLVLRGALNLSELKFSRNIVAIDRLRPLTTIDGMTTVHSLVYAYTDTIDLGGAAGQVKLSWLADESTVLVSNDVGRDLGVLEQIKLDNGQSLSGKELLQRVLEGGVSLRGTNYAADLSGSVGNDLVEAGYEADTLSGWAGNDTLRGNGGNDVLIGGLGNDLLDGGTGSDTLKFNLGDGADTMSVDGSDTLQLGAGLTKADVLIGKVGEKVANAVVLQLGKDSTDSITLAQAGSWNGLQVKLADGSVITGTEIMAEATKPDNLTLIGTTEADVLNGKDGNDTLLGLAGDDIIRGSTGRDRFEGGAGDDWLVDEGGITFVGQNRVYGSGGADTYVYNLGDGKDIVVDSSLSTDEDVLQFGAGIALSDIGVVRRRLSTSDLAIPSPDEALPNFFHNDEVFVVKGKGEVAFRSIGAVIRSVGETVSAGNWNVERLQFNDGTSLDRAGIEALFANAATDQTGSGANDTLLGKDGNDTLSGRAGNDTLKGGVGTDWLSGGKGSDVLDGGAGADTYAYSRGDGPDTLLADGQDTVVFDLGIRQADLLVGKLGASAANTVDVLIRNGSTSTADMLTLANASSLAGLQLKFADGSSLTGAEILAIATKPDNLMLDGTTKADKLTGKDGNDTLNGLAGNDTLAGGKGNDSLIGGKGNDTYLFNRGDGQDVIVDTDSALFNSDLLKLGGATSKQLWLTKAGNNLDIKILGTSDKVTVQDWFAGSSNRVEKITASDGKSLSASKVQALVNAMASFTPPADAASLPANAPAALTKLVASSWA